MTHRTANSSRSAVSDATFNTVLNDGVRVGTADTFRRTPLSVVTGDGVSSIYVTKAPLPEDASEGIGGVVDIRTRGALERREGISVSAQIRDNEFADQSGYRLSGRFTKHLTDTLGINLSASFRRRYADNFQINPTGDLEPLFPLSFTAPDGTTIFTDDGESDNAALVARFGGPVTQVDAVDAFTLLPQGFLGVENFALEQTDFEQAQIVDDNFNISGTIDWEVSGTTKLTFGGRYSRGERNETVSNIEFDADDDDFVDIDGDGIVDIRGYDDPEVVFEGQIEDELEIQQSYFLRGETKLDNWEFNYIVGYSRAFRDAPTLSVDFLQELEDVPGASGDDLENTFAPFIADGPFVSPNPQDLALFALGIDPFCLDAGGDPCGGITDFDEEIEDSSLNERWSALFDATRFFTDAGALEYVKFGAVFEDSQTRERDIDIFGDEDVLETLFPDGEAPGDFGLLTPGRIISFGPIDNPYSDIGFNGIPEFDRGGLLNLRRGSRALFDPNVDTLPSGEIVTLDADETYYTGYLQAKLNFNDKFTLVGGLRFEAYDGSFVSSTSAEAEIDVEIGGDDETFNLLADEFLIADVPTIANSASNFEILPRLVATYNINDKARLRGAFTTSISRPTFDLLGGPFETEVGIELNDDVDPNGVVTAADIDDANIDFIFSNPDLKNAYSYNFDLSFEYFFDRQNALSVAGFYKRIDDFIFSRRALISTSARWMRTISLS